MTKCAPLLFITTTLACHAENASSAPDADTGVLAEAASDSSKCDAGVGSVVSDVPSCVDPANRYLVYLHGSILDGKSASAPDTWTSGAYGHYDYTDILKALASAGFVVISELRASDQTWTNATSYITFYAQKAAGQVATLIAAGVPRDHIVVAGYSQGGFIAQVAGTLTNAADVRFAIMAGCAPATKGPSYCEFTGGTFAGSGSSATCSYSSPKTSGAATLKGNYLSIFATDDTEGHSCALGFQQASEAEGTLFAQAELILPATGAGHGIFYKVDDSWLGPVTRFAGTGKP